MEGLELRTPLRIRQELWLATVQGVTGLAGTPFLLLEAHKMGTEWHAATTHPLWRKLLPAKEDPSV